VTLQVTDAALGVLADLGYSPEYGARPLKRVVQKELETPLARGLVAGEYRDGDTLEVDADFDRVSLRIRIVRRRGEGEGEGEGKSEGNGKGTGAPALSSLGK
jgi:ATP-dependent Clp protease ATP-binding subunit ClpA